MPVEAHPAIMVIECRFCHASVWWDQRKKPAGAYVGRDWKCGECIRREATGAHAMLDRWVRGESGVILDGVEEVQI